jgi:hypothetical protein
MLRRRGRSGLAQVLEVPIEALAQRSALRPIGAGACEHDEIHRWQSTLLTKGFTSDAFQLVPVHGSSRGAA